MYSECVISNDIELNDLYIMIDSINDFNHITDKLKPGRLNFVYLGIQKYQIAWNLQKKINELNKENSIPDVVLFLEHENVYTFGKNADKDFLLNNHPEAEVVQTDRGGQVTYHGPGQLVGYPIINLNNYKKSVSWFMRSLEQIIINTLETYNISSERKDSLPGVWVDDDKICAMGVRISKWVTMHGFALNVKPDMKFFDSMIPCGIMEYGITSIYNQIGREIEYANLIKTISINFNNIFKVNEV